LRDREALKEKGLANLLLAMDCCAEVSQLATIAQARKSLLQAFQSALDKYATKWWVVEAIVNLVAKAPRFPEALPWLKDRVLHDHSGRVYGKALEAIAEHYHDDPTTLTWLKDCFQSEKQKWVLKLVVTIIDRLYPNDLDEQMRKWL
jgi:hypothetical protein